MKCEKFGSHFFSCQSLLLGTSVPNDNVMLSIIHKNFDVILCVCIKFCRCSYIATAQKDKLILYYLKSGAEILYYVTIIIIYSVMIQY